MPQAKYNKVKAELHIREGKGAPDPLQDYLIGACASWELDIWQKLHNAMKAAVTKCLSTVEGRNFAITSLAAEIADSFCELLSLDRQLEILGQNIILQNKALAIIRLLKEGT